MPGSVPSASGGTLQPDSGPCTASFDWHYCGFSLGDILMLCYELYPSWIGLNLLCILICICRFMAGGRVLAGFLETVSHG
jgi:hypothetical protein